MNLKLGSHVSMSGKSMLLGSAKEAESYGANTFMFYTGAPQNTKRKDISELNIDAAWNYMNEKNISDIVVHAPYIINLGNTVKPETYIETRPMETTPCETRPIAITPRAMRWFLPNPACTHTRGRLPMRALLS